MRILASMLGLLLVLAIIGLLAKRQWSAAPALPTLPGVATPASSPALQGQQLPQQYQKALEDAMRQPRPTGDEVP